MNGLPEIPLSSAGNLRRHREHVEHTLSMTNDMVPTDHQRFEAHEASNISAINGIVSLVNILRKRNILSAEEVSALYESMSLPLGMPRYAGNPSVQDIQLNLDRLFATVVEPG